MRISPAQVCSIFIFCLINSCLFAQESDSLSVSRQFSIRLHAGVARPAKVVPASTANPMGIELTYSRMSLRPKAWAECNCFSRVGAYANYLAFGNPTALGRTYGAGLYFEPYITYRSRLQLSLRLSAGLTYLTRVYDPETNPSNRYFSMPLSAMIAAALKAYYRLDDAFSLTLSGHFNHISNAGTRVPNQGINVPTIGLGLAWHPQPLRFPDTRSWPRIPLTRRWFGRATVFGAVRVLPADSRGGEMALPMVGVAGLGGYRLTRVHAVSAGLEWVDDQYFGEQTRRWRYKDTNYRQATALLGYEFWQGRFIFSIHHGWNFKRPYPYQPGSYQRYHLLYRLRSGLTAGIGVKSYVDDTKGFNAVVGWTL